MKIAFIYSKTKISGLLTKFFTGSYCYHVGWVDEKNNKMYDMNLIRRRRNWPYYPAERVVLIDAPVTVTAEFLESKLSSDENHYGFVDYLLFGLRPFYHIFGMSTRNAKGVICSEMIYNDLRECGWDVEFVDVPSPADLEKKFGVIWAQS